MIIESDAALAPIVARLRAEVLPTAPTVENSKVPDEWTVSPT